VLFQQENCYQLSLMSLMIARFRLFGARSDRTIRLAVPFGQMESCPRMSEAALQILLRENARRYCAGSSELPQHAPAPDANEMGQPEVL
jgi:hypothetical protein